MAELTSMMNIGREIAKKLRQVCLVHLYALEGAVTQTEFNGLSGERKRALKRFSDPLR